MNKKQMNRIRTKLAIIMSIIMIQPCFTAFAMIPDIPSYDTETLDPVIIRGDEMWILVIINETAQILNENMIKEVTHESVSFDYVKTDDYYDLSYASDIYTEANGYKAGVWSENAYEAVDDNKRFTVTYELEDVTTVFKNGEAECAYTLNDETVSDNKVKYGQEIVVPEAPTDSDKDFKGWKNGETYLAPGSKYVAKEDTVFTAEFEEKSEDPKDEEPKDEEPQKDDNNKDDKAAQLVAIAAKTEELASVMSKGKSGNGTIKGVYMSTVDTVSADITVTKGKIKGVGIDTKALKPGEYRLTLNTKIKLQLTEGGFTVINNGWDDKNFKKIKKFLKNNNKTGSQVLSLKPLKDAKQASYEIILEKGEANNKITLRIDVVDTNLNKKSMKNVRLETGLSQDMISANILPEEKVGGDGYKIEGNVCTIASLPPTKKGVGTDANESARFLSGIWEIGKTTITDHEVHIIPINKKGTSKIIAKWNYDGSLSIAKAEGSAKGNIKISYSLNGKKYPSKIKML